MSQAELIIKKLNLWDKQVLKLADGKQHAEMSHPRLKNAIKRSKARLLIEPINQKGNITYIRINLGDTILKLLEEKR